MPPERPHSGRDGRRYPLPGGRFAVASLSELPRLAVSAADLLGLRAWRALQSGTPRTAERRWAEAAVRRLRINIVLRGIEHIDPAERYVVAPLHEGFADVVALIASLPLQLRFVARSELEEWRVLGRALRHGRHVTVEPESPAMAYRKMLRAALDDSGRGDSLVVFPQGSILGIETAFQPGAFRLAAATRCPLLPVVVSGGHRVWEEPFSPLVRFGQPIYVEVLPAVAPSAAVASMTEIEATLKRKALGCPVAPRRFEPERDGWWDGYAYEIDPDFAELAAAVTDHRTPGRTATPG